MHKVLLTHQIVPGKFSELSDWLKEADAKRKAEDPDYKPPKDIFTKQEVFLK